jgi:hypothetical protein
MWVLKLMLMVWIEIFEKEYNVSLDEGKQK